MSRASLDWTDATEVSIWLAALRQSFADADAVALDMLRPPRSRELGPALHAEHYSAARAQFLKAIDYATAPEPHGEPSDPAGSGSSLPLLHSGIQTS